MRVVNLRRSALIALGLLVICAGTARAEPGLQSSLTATSGQGAGHVSLSPTAHDEHGTLFIAEGAARIHQALPDTTHLLQRAVDFSPGGVCAMDWLPIATIATSPGGAGAVHFERAGPTPGLSGFQFDVIFRLIRHAADGTSDTLAAASQRLHDRDYQIACPVAFSTDGVAATDWPIPTDGGVVDGAQIDAHDETVAEPPDPGR